MRGYQRTFFARDLDLVDFKGSFPRGRRWICSRSYAVWRSPVGDTHSARRQRQARCSHDRRRSASRHPEARRVDLPRARRRGREVVAPQWYSLAKLAREVSPGFCQPRVGSPTFQASSLLPLHFRFFFSRVSSRGIVAAGCGHGPPKLCVWASLESFCESPGSPIGAVNGRDPRPKFNEKTHPREKKNKNGGGREKQDPQFGRSWGGEGRSRGGGSSSK